MKIQSQLSRSDFQKVTLTILTSNIPLRIIAIAWASAMVGGGLLSETLLEKITPILCLVIAGTLVYFTIRRVAGKSYDSNSLLRERVEYQFNGKELLIKSLDTPSQTFLGTNYKLTEKKDLFFIRPGKNTYYSIMKTNLKQEEIDFLNKLKA